MLRPPLSQDLAGIPRISVHLRMGWSSKSKFLYILLWVSQLQPVSKSSAYCLELPAARTGSVFMLVAMILLGIAILTTEFFLLLLLMRWLYFQANLFWNILISCIRLYDNAVEIRQNIKTQKTRMGKIYWTLPTERSWSSLTLGITF